MTPPSSIAHYRITSKLGEGGMGAVYRATDTKLNREVAIKILPDSFASDPDRLARFTREALVLASLNHPNIAAIYGVEEGALVMELVEGETLRGPLPLATAIEYAHQITGALDAAHERGIIHRDLKPANIKVTPEGVIKILDFGLAKITEPPSSSGGAFSADSPTLTIQATQVGVIMGTAAYMSPEQARGYVVDKRADIWAFGVVLFEMLTGKPLFEGESVSDILGAVLKSEIDWKRLPVETPAHVRRLLERCLERDRRKRLRDLGDAWLDSVTPEAPPPAPQKSALAWIIAGVLAIALGAALLALWHAPKAIADRPLIQLDLDAGPDEIQNLAVSPDGTRVVFVARGPKGSHLAMRRLDQTSITALAGTDGATLSFFSPDGRSVGFFTADKLMKLSLDGGAAFVLADVDLPGGGTWGDGGSIAAVLSKYASRIVSSVPAVGGAPQSLTTRDAKEAYQLSPHLLPRGKGLLFTIKDGSGYSVHLVAPGRSQPAVLLRDAIAAHYVEGGYLVFFRQGKIFAAGFDLDRLQLTSDPIPMVEDVALLDDLPLFDVASSGALVYRRGTSNRYVVARIDASGQQEPILSTPATYSSPKLSPDGKRLVIEDGPDARRRLLIHDLTRGTSSRLTLDDREQRFPLWTPDGRQVIFHSTDGTFAVRADGAEQSQSISADRQIWCMALSRDGRLAACGRVDDKTSHDIGIAPVEPGGTGVRLGNPVIVAGEAGSQFDPAFSPDGRWLAYMSNESGRFEIMVISLTAEGRAAGGKWQVSLDGGYDPVWPAAGSQLFYRSQTNHIEVVSYSVRGDSFIAEKPHHWMPRPIASYPMPIFDMTPDGKQAIAVVDSGAPETHIRVVLNFADEIRRRLAGAAR